MVELTLAKREKEGIKDILRDKSKERNCENRIKQIY